MRPLSVKNMIPCRTDRSILKVIATLFGPAMACCICCHCGSRLTEVQCRGHLQGTELKGLEMDLDDGNSGSAEFSGVVKESQLLLHDKLVFLDLQLFDF